MAVQVDHESQMVGCGMLGKIPVYIIKCAPLIPSILAINPSTAGTIHIAT